MNDIVYYVGIYLLGLVIVLSLRFIWKELKTVIMKG